MKKNILYWAPRILAILFSIFISLFALDVFGQGYGILGTIWALIVHLVPTYLVVIALVIAWKREYIGGIIFILLGIFYMVLALGKVDILGCLIISGPVILIGVLFLLNWFLVKKK